MADTGFSVPLVPFAHFKKNLLPPLHPDLKAEVAPIVDALKNAVELRNKKGDEVLSSRWKWFPKDPSKTTDKEDTVFAPFATIAERVAFHATALLKAKPSSAKQTAEFFCNPSMTPLAINRDNTAKPDSYAVRIDRPARVVCQGPGVPHWDDIIMPLAGEKRKGNGDEDFNDNNRKLMWSLTHGMRATVHRRFMFGYTIEDTSMRAWFCSRSDIIVSEQFNFITEHSELVHLFLSIMFANPVDLGYDPTVSVKYFGDNAGSVYDLTIHCSNPAIDSTEPLVFQATEIIANLGADVLQGRGTRVWRGFGPINSAASKSDPIVVKDCWIDDDREKEGKILADILEAAMKKDESSPVAKYVPLIKAHFLEVVCHGEVMVPVDGKEVRDHTFEVMRRGAPLPDGKELPLRRLARSRESKKPAVGSRSVGTNTLHAAKQKGPRRYHKKVHYRIAFRSRVACRPIDTVNSVQRLLSLLFQVFEGISALHELGWIHRDLSTGNVLAEGTDGPAKIVDLEFCKRIDDTSRPHDGRTGTPFVIPIEVQVMRYRFLFLPDPPNDPSPDSLPALLLQPDATSPTPAPHIPQMSFTANPLHDLESLWWLAVYLTLPRSIVSEEPLNPEDQKRNEQWTIQLFTEQAARDAAMREDAFFSDGTLAHHELLRFIAKYLDIARKYLVRAYYAAELNCRTTGVIDAAATMSAHTPFGDQFKFIRDSFMRARKDFQLSEISTSYLQPSMEVVKPVAGSLDPGLLLERTEKHQRDPVDSVGERGNVTSPAEVPVHMSPSQELPSQWRSKRMRRGRGNMGGA